MGLLPGFVFCQLAVVCWGYEPRCSGSRRSIDSIVWLGQKTHSSYDATHRNTLNASMASLARNYASVAHADVLVWHEGDLDVRDADALSTKTNVRWCRLEEASGWGVPSAQRTAAARDTRWAPGYLYMIRWYAVTMWDVLAALGYEWVMRMDDDSFVLSAVPYDVFADMRRDGYDYGFRSFSRECDKTFGAFVDAYAQRERLALPSDDGTIFCEKFPRYCAADGVRTLHPKSGGAPGYCQGPGRLGFYNNWFVTRIGWWRGGRAAALRRAFDESALIFTHRANDLIFQTAAVRLLLPRRKWRHFADFTYQHHTVRDGAVRWGGLETGYADAGATRTLARYLRRWHPDETLATTNRVLQCHVQLSINDSHLRTVNYIPHGATKWKYLAAPYCNKHGKNFLW